MFRLVYAEIQYMGVIHPTKILQNPTSNIEKLGSKYTFGAYHANSTAIVFLRLWDALIFFL